MVREGAGEFGRAMGYSEGREGIRWGYGGDKVRVGRG